ncbi:MAG: CPBP family intramembrane metalloprotease [Bacteroidia bacterium]|nr:CPBP family intramembrane metalloprotease [Bacteroidia bacterium]MCF8428337.1 CPBP family intramembrane metalloprotease [Bacteroidia bacterium]
MEGSSYRIGPDWPSYIGKILILVGMVLVFGAIGAMVSTQLCRLLFHVDFTQIDLNAIKKEDVQVIAALKLFQTLSGGVGMFLVPALIFPKVIKYPINSMITYNMVPKFWMLLLAFTLIIVSVPLISWLYQINQNLSFPAAWSELEQQIRAMENQATQLTKVFIAADNISMLLLNIFVVALVPAVCEEFFFRGILLQYTRFVFSNEWVAIIVSAIVFSGFHGQFYGFLPRLILGVFLGYLYLRGGGIWVVVFAHFVNNAMAVLTSYYEKDLTAFQFFNEEYQFPWYWAIISMATVYGLFRLYNWAFWQHLQNKIKKR